MLRRGVGASLSGLTSGFFGIFSSSKNIVRRTALPLQAWWALNRCVKKKTTKRATNTPRTKMIKKCTEMWQSFLAPQLSRKWVLCCLCLLPPKASPNSSQETTHSWGFWHPPSSGTVFCNQNIKTAAYFSALKELELRLVWHKKKEVMQFSWKSVGICTQKNSV